MKIIPTKYKLEGQLSSSTDKERKDLHQDYTLRRTIVKGISKTLTRMATKPFQDKLTTGDVVIGTRAELLQYFGSEIAMNNHTQSAAPLKEVVCGDTAQFFSGCHVTAEAVESLTVDSLLRHNGNYQQILNSIPGGNDVTYKGYKIETKIFVNGVEFKSISEAQQSIDLVVKLGSPKVSV